MLVCSSTIYSLLLQTFIPMGSRAITEICSPANTHRMILTLAIEMITHGQLLTVPR